MNIHRMLLQEVYLRDYRIPCACDYDKCETLKMRGRLQAALNIPLDIAQARFEDRHILKIRSTGETGWIYQGEVLKYELKSGSLTLHIEGAVPTSVNIDNLLIEVTPPTRMIPDSVFVSLAENLEMVTDA
ncbi:hypothetical protein LCGC14_0347360 [marine sediment metagenome]|uniref:Uncharacterized protein n=1 Tax=marine sediment metagenome TaxID=412755 RepID=A0A0F9THA4_9ZZZZ